MVRPGSTRPVPPRSRSRRRSASGWRKPRWRPPSTATSSTSHVMAQAVTQLFPGARYSIGPAIENGFYYDFELPGGATFSDDDLAAIEARMREIIKADQPFVRDELSPADALKLFADQPYKLEI